jgi:hypothetical protein
MPLKLKFNWKEVQAGIWSLRSEGWHHGVVVWHRKERLYYWHPADITAELIGPWLTLAVAQVACENGLREVIIGTELPAKETTP